MRKESDSIGELEVPDSRKTDGVGFGGQAFRKTGNLNFGFGM